MAGDNIFANIDAFSLHNGMENIGARWQKWLKRFDNFLIAAGITEDRRKEAMLLHSAGEEVFDIYCSLPDPSPSNPPLTCYEIAKAKLNSHFVPKINTEFEIFNFRQAKQLVAESIEEYYARLLKLSTNCSFNDKNREIKSQIIQCTTSARLRKFGLAENPTLEQLLAQAKAYELTQSQAQQMEPSTEHVSRISNHRRKTNTKFNQQALTQTDMNTRDSTNHYNNQSNSQRNTNNQCRNCGNRWHTHGRQECPARNVACHFCSKQGHFAKCCITKQKAQQTQGTQSQLSPPSQHCTSTNNNNRSLTTNHVTSNIETTNFNTGVQGDSSSEHSFQVSIVNRISDVPTININIDNNVIKFIIDTGSSVNLIGTKTFSKLCNKTLFKNCTDIYAYCASNRLKIVGKFTAVLKFNNNTTEAEIHVVEGDCQSLLSYNTSCKLNLIKITNNVTQTVINTEYVQNRYPKLCKGIGNLNNCEIKLHIDLNVVPVAQKHRRIPYHLRGKVEEELNRLETQDIIEKSTGATPWLSPIVIVPKRNKETIRLCVDMRSANKAILRERHITPTLDDIINQLNGSVMYSSIDLRDGYHQLTLSEESRYITTFSTHAGLYRYKRLSFGINAAAEIFQNSVRQVIANIPGVINYSDDILVFGKTVEQHNISLKALLRKLQEVHLTINTGKCVFSVPKIKFFGYIFSKEGVQPDSDKVNSIVNMKPPENPSEVRSLLGMINYLSKFLPNLAQNTKILRDLTLKDATWEWKQEHNEVFQTLKSQLQQATTLSYFDVNKSTDLFVDAGPEGLGALLTQGNNVIAYASRTLTSVEKRYSQIEKETLACTWAIQHFNIYLYGSKFTLHTDHLPLVNILGNSRSCPSARIERLLLRIQPYEFKVVHQTGKSNPSDYLSRHPLEMTSNHTKIEEYVNFIIHGAMPTAMTVKQVQEATKNDKVLTTLMKAIKNSKDKWNQPELTPFEKIKTEITIQDDIVLRGTRIILPSSLQRQAIELAHKGHMGIVKTKQLLRTKVWFPNIDKLTETFIRNCTPCQAVTDTKHRDPITSSQLPDVPFSHLDIDFVGPFNNKKYIFILVDEHSRYPLAEVISSTSFASIKPIFERTFSTFGIPKQIKSDNGPPFNGLEMKLFLENLGIRHLRVTPYWPEANGLAERFVKTFKKSLICAHLETKQFDSQIQQFLLNYRSTPHSTTQKTPFELVFQRNVNNMLPMHKIQETQQELHQSIQLKDKENRRKQKEYADKKRHAKTHTFKEGDMVLCKQIRKNSLTPRFNPHPYKIKQVKGTQIIAERDGESIIRNSSFFKYFHSNTSKSLFPKFTPLNTHLQPQPNMHPTKPFPLSTSWKINLRQTPNPENIVTTISDEPHNHERNGEDEHASVTCREEEDAHLSSHDDAKNEEEKDCITSTSDAESEAEDISVETTSRPQRISKKPAYLDDYYTDFKSE